MAMTDEEVQAAVQRHKDWQEAEAIRREAEKSLPLYRVRVRFSGSTDYFVRANSEEEAGDKAAELWENGEEGQHCNDWDWRDETVTLADAEAQPAGGQANACEALAQREVPHA